MISWFLYGLAAITFVATIGVLALHRRRRRRPRPLRFTHVITAPAGAPISRGEMVVIGTDGRARPASTSTIRGVALAPSEDDHAN